MGEGIVGEFGVSMYTLLYLKQIISKDLHSSGNSVQCYVAPCIEGSLGENGYMHIYGWMPLLFTWKYHNIVIWFSSVQFSRSVMSDSLRPHSLQQRRASLFITNSRSSLRLTSIESVMPSSHLILCRRLFLLPPIPPNIRVFSNESTLRYPNKNIDL